MTRLTRTISRLRRTFLPKRGPAPARRAHLGIESLEKRDVPAILDPNLVIIPIRPVELGTDNVLRIRGWMSVGNNQANIRLVPGYWFQNVEVTFNGVKEVFPTYTPFGNYVSRIEYAGNDLKDWVYNSTDIPMTAYGGGGDDFLDGGSGNDYLYGQDGTDQLLGRGGDDYMEGGGGADYMYGFEGNDGFLGGDYHLTSAGPDLGDYVEAGGGSDYVYGQDGVDTIFGGDRWLTSAGPDLGDYLEGGGDRDYIYGQDGVDTIWGGDHWYWSYGADTGDFLEGGGDRDYIYGQNGDDTLRGGDYWYWSQGADAGDVLDGGANRDSLYGQAGADTLYGVVGEDYLDGATGADTLEIRFNLDTYRQNANRTFVPTWDYSSGYAGTDTFHVVLEMGSFGSSVLQPFVQNVRTVTSRFQSAVDLLNSKVLGTLFTYASLLKTLGVADLQPFIDSVNFINKELNFSTLGGSVDLGRFQVSSPTSISQPVGGAKLPLSTRLGQNGVHVPLLEDATQPVRLLFGHNLDLVTVVLPPLSASKSVPLFNYYVPTQIGVIHVKADGSAGVSASATFGYDTRGLRNGSLWDGFFAKNVNFTLWLGLDVSAADGVVVAEGGVGVTVKGSIGFTFQGAGSDGKIRFTSLSPVRAPSVEGKLTIACYAFVEILFGALTLKQQVWSKDIPLF